MEIANVRTVYVDEVGIFLHRMSGFRPIPHNQQDREAEVEKPKLLFGMALGAAAATGEEEEEAADASGGGTRTAKAGQRVRRHPYSTSRA